MESIRSLFPLISLVLLAAVAGCAPAVSPEQVRDLAGRVDELRTEQVRLAAQLEESRSKQLLLEARLQDQQTTLVGLRQALEAQKVTASREKTASGRGQGAPAAQPPAADTAASEIYYSAFSAYAAGRFAEAGAEFQNFLRRFPNHEFAAYARYWLGECYYSQEQYQAAVIEFEKVVESDPTGPKTAGALLKLAASLRQLGQPARAEQALQLLRTNFPEQSAPLPGPRAE